MPTSADIRQQFLDFFTQKHGHTFVPSSPVVPHDDPTLLFTNAGMNQFKPYFLGTEKAAWSRAANTQKCIRAGGKHNDLDDVGRSRRHHTFFEMLGNWSFGDYFKRGAIEMSWELVTQVWQIDPRRIHVTCYEGDEAHGIPRDTEAAELWKEIAGLPDDHIHFMGKDNFWEMGETGPCGPCTEIFIDRTPDMTGGPSVVKDDDPRVMEFWNNVFIQYNRDANGKLSPLPAQHVDTGMGFERICQILQDKQDNFGIDLWDPYFAAISKLSGKQYTGLYPKSNEADPEAEAGNPQLRVDIAFRAIADHVRCLTFALTDGAVPSNDGRGYVLRRILRRAVRLGRQQLGLVDPFVHRLVPIVVESMGEAFPELGKNPDHVAQLIREEEESFGKTIERGIALFDDAAERGGQSISADDAFKLYDTYGFPLDLTQVMAQERGLSVDVEGFERLMEEARHRARGVAGKADTTASLVEIVQQVNPPATQFLGYSGCESQGQTPILLHKFDGHAYKPVKEASQGDRLAIVLGKSPFYAEAGGQVGDTGSIATKQGDLFRVTDTIKVGDVFFHLGTVEKGTFRTTSSEGDAPAMVLKVDYTRRQRIRANHTATHLLNRALRLHVNPDADQKGSLVDDEKLRFDFSQNSAVTAEQIEKVEATVNADIDADLRVHDGYAPIEEARNIHGLRAVFGEKYPPKVRVVSIGVPVEDLLQQPDSERWGNYSIEFCGGTHLAKTGDAKRLVVVREEAVSRGIRRMVALTGDAAEKAQDHAQQLLDRITTLAQAPVLDLDSKVEQIHRAIGDLTLPLLKRHAIEAGLADLSARVREYQKAAGRKAEEAVVEHARAIAEQADGLLVVAEVPGADGKSLRTAMDVVRKKQPDAALLLGAAADGKVTFIASVPKPLIDRGLKAGDWVREVAKVADGSGGGRPDMAQAGGKDPAKLSEALDVGRSFAQTKLG